MKRYCIIMYGCDGCNMNCSYCMKRKKTEVNEFVLNKQKLKEKILAMANGDTKFSFSLWGGEPYVHFEQLKETVAFLKEEFPNSSFLTSTNGLLLKDKKIQEWIIKNNINIQLSHDGIGNFQRGTINVLEDSEISNFLSYYLKHKGFVVFNCVLTNNNWSIYSNRDFFKKWIKDNNLQNTKVKLNFSPYLLDKEKNNEDMVIHGENVDLFINEYKQMVIDAYNNKPYTVFLKQRLIENLNYNLILNSNYKNGCSKFASGVINYHSYIDTSGEFCVCNLYDSSYNKDFKCEERPEYCYGCKFQNMGFCHPCPNSGYSSKCDLNYKFCELIEWHKKKFIDAKYSKEIDFAILTNEKDDNELKQLKVYRRFKLNEKISKDINTEEVVGPFFKRCKNLLIDSKYNGSYEELQELLDKSDNIIYDRNDNQSAVLGYYQKEELILKKANIVINSSKWLFEDSINRHPSNKVYYVPNGNELFEYKPVKKFEKKTAIYIGNSYKVDLKLISSMCVEYPDWNFLIYSTAIPEESKIKHSNLFYYQAVPLNELFETLCKCHVGLSLFKGDSCYCMGMLPDKLFNYINARIPMIYNNIPYVNLEDYKEVAFQYKPNILNELPEISDYTFKKLERSWDDVYKEWKKCLVLKG